MTAGRGASSGLTQGETGLRVLITNAHIEHWTGSELYVRDVATELARRGHSPVVFSPRLGGLAETLRARGIPVVDDLAAVGAAPDVIHGQHHLETMTALTHFPGTPTVFFCHGILPWEEIPPLHPRIVRYVAVSAAVRERLVRECRIPAERVTTILNFVDLERFLPRPPLPAAPRRALVFSNQADEKHVLGAAREACARAGIAMDSVGRASGRPSRAPEDLLGGYDIVFARGRAALEALAVGAAVICCDREGAGPMVATHNLGELRRGNLGLSVLDRPVTAEVLTEELRRYDPIDAAAVSREVRATAGMSGAVDGILEAYRTATSHWEAAPKPDPAAESLALSAYLRRLSDELYRTRSRLGKLSRERATLRAAVDSLRSGPDAPGGKPAAGLFKRIADIAGRLR